MYEIPEPDVNPAKLSNLELLWQLLRIIWRRHDTGGVSMSRSHQSRVLDGAKSLFQEQAKQVGDLTNHMTELLDEVVARAWRYYDHRDEGLQLSLIQSEDLPVEALSDESIIEELLCELRAWYREDAKRPDSLWGEHKLIEHACVLLGPGQPEAALHNPEELMREARNRSSAESLRRMGFYWGP